MTNEILIWNNDQSKFPNETSCIESISVFDTLDVTRDLDVSLDCACSAEKVYLLSHMTIKSIFSSQSNLVFYQSKGLVDWSMDEPMITTKFFHKAIRLEWQKTE